MLRLVARLLWPEGDDLPPVAMYYLLLCLDVAVGCAVAVAGRRRPTACELPAVVFRCCGWLRGCCGRKETTSRTVWIGRAATVAFPPNLIRNHVATFFVVCYSACIYLGV
jgi:hypothetical protein